MFSRATQSPANQTQNSMRIAFYVTFIVHLTVSAILYLLSPAVVAAHFDIQGNANGWMSRESDWAIMTATSCLLFVVFGFSDWLLRHYPALVNIPNAKYWKKKENLTRAIEIATPFFLECGIYTFLFLAAVQWLSFQANRLNPPRMGQYDFWLCMGAFLAVMLAWTVRIYIAYRIPKETDTDPESE